MKKITSLILVLSILLFTSVLCFAKSESDDIVSDCLSTSINYNDKTDHDFFENATAVLQEKHDNVTSEISSIPDEGNWSRGEKVLFAVVGVGGVTTVAATIIASGIIFKDNIKKFFCEDLKDFYDNGVKPFFKHGIKDFFVKIFKKNDTK